MASGSAGPSWLSVDVVVAGEAVVAIELRGRERRPVSSDDVVVFLLALLLSVVVDDCDALRKCSTVKTRGDTCKFEIIHI